MWKGEAMKTYYTVKDIGGRKVLQEQQGKAGDILKRIDK